MPQLEGPTTKIFNDVLGGFGEKKKKEREKKKEDWQQLLAQVPIFKKKKATAFLQSGTTCSRVSPFLQRSIPKRLALNYFVGYKAFLHCAVKTVTC